MENLSLQKCYHHSQREAVARCPECGRFFCRECITEHEDRVLCTSCLNVHQSITRIHKLKFGTFIRMGQFLTGLFILWMFFYYLGQALLSIPSDFHEGTIWQTQWWLSE